MVRVSPHSIPCCRHTGHTGGYIVTTTWTGTEVFIGKPATMASKHGETGVSHPTHLTELGSKRMSSVKKMLETCDGFGTDQGREAGIQLLVLLRRI